MSSAQKMNEVMSRLREARLKPTSARQCLLKILISNHGPFTIEELHQAVGVKSCDLVTVYRTVKSLEDVGIIERCEWEGGTARFEYRDPLRHHHHIICSSCQRVESIAKCPVKLNLTELSAMGYQVVGHKLNVYGVCRDCQSSTQ